MNKQVHIEKVQINKLYQKQNKMQGNIKSVYPQAGKNIYVTGSRNNSNYQRNQIKSQIDIILQKDYLNWKLNQNSFNALNSFSAKNNTMFKSYVEGIYKDYQIKDPLQDRNWNLTTYPNVYQKTTFQKRPSTAIEKRNIRFYTSNNEQLNVSPKKMYQTPTKQHKKALSVVSHSKQLVRQDSQKQKQKQKFMIKPQNVFLTDQKQISPNKVKFIERTAPSQKSSFNLTNSKNQGLNGLNFTFSEKKNKSNDIPLYNSQLSLANRLEAQTKNFYSYEMLYDKQKPPNTEFTSTREFLSIRKLSNHQNSKMKQEKIIGSEVSLGEMNPQRAQKRKKNEQYAQRIISSYQKKNLFIPEQKIKQSFRYCVGCQLAILQTNIAFHQKECSQFKRILNLPNLNEIVNQLDNKILKISKNITQKQNNITDKDHVNMAESSSLLVKITNEYQNKKQQIKVKDFIKSQQFTKNYGNAIDIGTNWGLLTQEVNKLKWFLSVKKNFQQLKLKSQKVQIKSD